MVKLDKADRFFSLYIRERDNWTCQRCGKIFNRDEPNILQNSHYHGRASESTRFDPDNCDSACHYCHRYWESHKAEYKKFKENQLGKERFKLLNIRNTQYRHKNRIAQAIIWKANYIRLCKSKNIIPRK